MQQQSDVSHGFTTTPRSTRHPQSAQTISIIGVVASVTSSREPRAPGAWWRHAQAVVPAGPVGADGLEPPTSCSKGNEPCAQTDCEQSSEHDQADDDGEGYDETTSPMSAPRVAELVLAVFQVG